MTIEELTQRIVTLETEVTELKAAEKARQSQASRSWIEKITGSMANDPGFEEMIRLGKEWRDAQREDYDTLPREAGAA